MPGLGDEFRAAREARHLSLSDVSEQIHIRSVYLQCLEDEDWQALPAPVYVRGFMRTYARFLGLDAEHAVAQYNATLGDDSHRHSDPIFTRTGRRSPSVWLWGAMALAAFLVAFVSYNFFKLQDQRASASAAPVSVVSAPAAPQASDAAREAPIVAARAAAPQRAGRAARTLELRLSHASWLLVTVDGARRLEGTYPAGTRKAFHGKLVAVRTGNGGAVDLLLNGKELGTMGASGAVVDRTIPLGAE